jgi:hypothetical protein
MTTDSSQELPRSMFEGHRVAARLLVLSRVLPPLSALLPIHCIVFMVLPYKFGFSCGFIWPMAQMKPVSSRATAVATCTFSLPRASNLW